MLTSPPRRTGRPPTRGKEGKRASVTVQLDPTIKNLLIDLAEGYGLSLSEYLSMLVVRDSQS